MNLLPAAQLRAAGTRLELYPVAPGLSPVSKVFGQAQKRKLPLTQERVWHSDSPGQWFLEVVLARFAADGPVRVDLTARQGDWGHPASRSLGRDLFVDGKGDRLSFQLPGPGQYSLQAPALADTNGAFTLVFWVDDLRRLEQTRAAMNSSNVVDVTQREVRSDARLDQTRVIQSLLDRRGTVCFPAGVYRVGTLRVSSDTTVYLALGAVVRALDGEDAVGPEFIAIENARNV